jgi:cytoskeletal protein CcmA (bactofilin family)
MTGGRVGVLVGGGALGALVGLGAGALLAIPTAEAIRGGLPVVFGAAAVFAVAGVLVAYRQSDLQLRRQRSRNSRVEGLVFRSTFKRGHDQAPKTPQQSDAPWSEPHATRSWDRNEEAEARPMQQREVSMMSGGELNALLGRGSEFEGKLAFEGKVRIDGNFTGEISTNDMLVIGDGAKVSAEISCGTVIVEGEVIGNIKATSAVELHRPAKVHGDITTPSLMIEKGVIFEGHTKMESVQSSNVVSLHAAED